MEKDWRDKLRALAPLVLRLGVATVLFQHGYATLLAPSGTDAVAAIAEQQSISFAQLAAIGELKIAVLLALGLATRIAALPVIGVGVLAALPASCVGLTGSASEILRGIAPHPTVGALFVACGLTLLVSGCGWIGADNWFVRRKRNPPTED